MQHSVDARRWMGERDAQVCREARNAVLDTFPKIGRSSFRLVCYALDPDRKTGQGHVREYTEAAGINYSHLVSVWWRAARREALPMALYTPKYVLTRLTLVRAVALVSNPEIGLQGASNFLGYSSIQGFGRHVHRFLGVYSADLRQWDWEGELERVLTHLRPFAGPLTTMRDGRMSGAFKIAGGITEKCQHCGGAGLVSVRSLVAVAERRVS